MLIVITVVNDRSRMSGEGVPCSSRYCAPPDCPDVVLTVEGERFHVKKDVLREKCPYFDAMFGGRFAEHQQDEVAIEIISAKSMTFILDFILLEIIEVEDMSDVAEYIEAAMFFQLQDLVDLIVDGLITKLNYYSWAKVLQIVKQFNFIEIEKKVICFGLYNFINVKKYIECIDSLPMLHWYLSHVYLNTPNEYQVFEAGCDWLTKSNVHGESDNILVVLSCLNYRNIDAENLEKILNHPMVQSNNVAQPVIEKIKLIISQNIDIDGISSEIFKTNHLNEVPNKLNKIICGLLLSVKERCSIEQPCVIRKRKNIYLKRYNPKINKLEIWLPVANANWWGHNVLLWKGFNIIVSCGETNMGKNIWNTDILLYNILDEKWSVMNRVPSEKRRHAAAVINDDLLYIIAGVDSKRITLSTVLVYDMNNDSWSKLPLLPETCQSPVATFHKGELYVSGEMLHVFRNNHWVTLFKNSMRHNSILSYKNCLFFAQNWRNCLLCWDPDTVIEYMRTNEVNKKQTKYNITSMCRIGKHIYFLTEPEVFDKQTYCIERCSLDDESNDTETLMETVATADYTYNTSDCFAVPSIDIDDISINDYGSRWLKQLEHTNGEENGSNG